MTVFTPEQFGGKTEVDSTAALQKTFEAAAKTGGEVYLPSGRWFGNVKLSNVRGIAIRGDNRGSSTLLGINPYKPVIDIKGLWFSSIRHLTLETTQGLNCGVLEIDSSDKLGVQGNTYQDLIVNAQGINDEKKSTYAVTLCKEGIYAQGDFQLFNSCHFLGASEACVYQCGMNALNNKFDGCNFSNYPKHGVCIVGGSVHFIGCGFQSIHGYEQVKNGGWDIAAFLAGDFVPSVVEACRTESLQFYKGGISQPVSIIGCQQHSGVPHNPNWKPFHSVEIENGVISNSVFQYPYIWQKNPDNKSVQVVDDYMLKADDKNVLVLGKKNTTITLHPVQNVPEGHTVTVCVCPANKGKVTVVAPEWHGIVEDTKRPPSITVNGSARFTAMGGAIYQKLYYRT